MTQSYKSFIWTILAYLITSVQPFKILVKENVKMITGWENHASGRSLHQASKNIK